MNWHDPMFDVGTRVFFGLIFAGLGIFFVGWPWGFAAVCPYFRKAFLPPAFRNRVFAAADVRKDAEGISAYLGVFPGVVALLLTALTFTTQASLIVLYAVLCLSTALTLGIGFAQFRAHIPRRSAQLAPRDPFEPVPAWAYAAAGVAVVMPAFYVVGAAMKILIVAVGITILALGWLIAQAPALLAGADPGADIFVDGRLRRYRATYVVSVSVMPAFVAFALSGLHRELYGFVAYLVVFCAYAALARLAGRAVSANLTPEENALLSPG